MKRINTVTFVVGLMLLVQSAAWGQTITIDSVSGTHFCAGDPLSVTFTATGAWAHNNAFTLQLSNDSGLFDNGFKNLGSIKDTAPGTYTIITSAPTFVNVIWRQASIQRVITEHDSLVGADSIIVRDTTYDTIPATRYHVRVIGDTPYVESADNGHDIVIGAKPSHVVSIDLPSAIAVGVPVTINFQGDPFAHYSANDREHIIFGTDATPSSYDTMEGDLMQGFNVTYNSPGPKTFYIESVAPGECSVIDSFQTYVYGCENPIIPHDAIILANDTVFTGTSEGNKTFWLNPGVSLDLGENGGDTIFAEAGSSVSGENSLLRQDIVYLKKGASSVADDLGLVIYHPGASVVTNVSGTLYASLECPDLTFDYTVAPPNSVMHINDGEGVVTNNNQSAEIEISPNPTTGMTSLDNVPSSASITVTNVLGETMQEMKAAGSNLTLDLSKEAPGTYYVRIASGNSVVTKKVVKE